MLNNINNIFIFFITVIFGALAFFIASVFCVLAIRMLSLLF